MKKSKRMQRKPKRRRRKQTQRVTRREYTTTMEGIELVHGFSQNGAHVIGSRIPPNTNRFSLRRWWHRILRDHGRYSCYAMFLTLPADKETIHYLTDFGEELHMISGKNCLIITLSKTAFKQIGLLRQIGLLKPISFDQDAWNLSVKEQTSEGYSLTVARLFDIDLTEFPCLVLFRDIRSPEHIVVTLKGMTTEKIADKMRSVFSTINAAVRSKADPLEALEKRRKRHKLREAGQAIVSNIRSIAGKTLETALTALIKASIPGP